MKIAISGISGFTGSELKTYFFEKGWDVIEIPRKLVSESSSVQALSELISDVNVVINLRGAPIIKRHTRTYKRILWESRIHSTKAIVRAMEQNSKKPELFISASATGIYKAGKKHDEYQHETDPGFLGQLCTAWEKEALHAESLGIRTCVLRLGIVLGKEGGVINKLFPLFNAGLGAVILPARAPFPWIHIGDFLEICQHLILCNQCSGVYNLSADASTTQKDFAKAFAATLKRPLLFVLPPVLLRILFGKGADIITKTAEVRSLRLGESGYHLMYSNIRSALSEIFGKNQYEKNLSGKS